MPSRRTGTCFSRAWVAVVHNRRRAHREKDSETVQRDVHSKGFPVFIRVEPWLWYLPSVTLLTKAIHSPFQGRPPSRRPLCPGSRPWHPAHIIINVQVHDWMLKRVRSLYQACTVPESDPYQRLQNIWNKMARKNAPSQIL
jgi:hypothetical protein